MVILQRAKVVERYQNYSGEFARIISTPDDHTLEVRVNGWSGDVIFSKQYATRNGARIALSRRYGLFDCAGMEETIRKTRRIG